MQLVPDLLHQRQRFRVDVTSHEPIPYLLFGRSIDLVHGCLFAMSGKLKLYDGFHA